MDFLRFLTMVIVFALCWVLVVRFGPDVFDLAVRTFQAFITYSEGG